MTKNIIYSIYLLHGLVHVWYILLLAQIVPWKSEIGWTGQSFLLSEVLSEKVTRWIGIILYGGLTISFIIIFILGITNKLSSSYFVIWSLIISIILIILYFDGEFNYIIEKGAIGIVVNVLLILLFTYRPVVNHQSIPSEKLDKTNILIDISYFDENQQIEVLKKSENPVIVSQRNSLTFANTRDNISDKVLTIQKKQGNESDYSQSDIKKIFGENYLRL